MRRALLIFIPVIVLAAVILVLQRGPLAVAPSSSPSPSVQACSLEAKQCPDGSYVARTGPDCEFAPCPNTRTVQLFYYDPVRDTDAGIIRCSAQGLVAVTREILRTQTPIQDTVRLLLKGELTDAERAQGITTEFPLAGLSLTGASQDTAGVLTLTFRDDQYKTGGGSCRIAVLWAQIEATAGQFDGITAVRFLPEELFQP